MVDSSKAASLNSMIRSSPSGELIYTHKLCVTNTMQREPLQTRKSGVVVVSQPELKCCHCQSFRIMVHPDFVQFLVFPPLCCDLKFF